MSLVKDEMFNHPPLSVIDLPLVDNYLKKTLNRIWSFSRWRLLITSGRPWTCLVVSQHHITYHRYLASALPQDYTSLRNAPKELLIVLLRAHKGFTREHNKVRRERRDNNTMKTTPRCTTRVLFLRKPQCLCKHRSREIIQKSQSLYSTSQSKKPEIQRAYLVVYPLFHITPCWGVLVPVICLSAVCMIDAHYSVTIC